MFTPFNHIYDRSFMSLLYIFMNNNSEKNFLLSPKGLLIQSGRTKQMVYEYDRLAIPPLRRLTRLKERDRYVFGNSRVQVIISLADYGYIGMVTTSVFNLEERTKKTTVNIIPLSFGITDLPASPEWGDVVLRSGEASLDFSKASGKRYIRGRVERFDDVRSLYVNMTAEETQSDAVCSVVGNSAEPETFRMTYKKMAMPASGTVVYGADTFNLSAENCFCTLDWERSVLSKGTSSRWMMGQGAIEEGGTVAFSFSACPSSKKLTDNAVFINGELYDPGDIKLTRNDNDGTLRLHSPANRIDLVFTPLLSGRADAEFMRFSLYESELTCGEWNGTIKLGTGKAIEINHVIGFAEKNHFRW